MLQLKNIHKHYQLGDLTIRALDGVDLTFRKSEFVSILGPSGCGKTTLLNLIGGLDRYTSGDILIDGTSTKEYKNQDWDSYRNHRIGFVFQNYNLIPHLNILKNVELALTLSGISAKERKARAEEALSRVGLGRELKKRPNQLSGGQMQRVAIARALINNPEILLADEPTGALDSTTSIQIMELIQEISKERLVIMVTHNAEIANKYSKRIINLLDGKVVGDTNPYHEEAKKEIKLAKQRTKKTSMRFWTALSLSFKNLITKKARTILTAFAGSIGIIGIALVLSLSNGFNLYIEKMQADTLSSFPLEISSTAIDYSAFMNDWNTKYGQKYPEAPKVFVNPVLKKLSEGVTKNNITDQYVEYVDNIDPSLYYDIVYQTGLKVTNYVYTDFTYEGKTMIAPLASTTGGFTPAIGSFQVFSQGINSVTLFSNQYDIIAGRIPENENELLLVVDEYNQLTDIALIQLGIMANGEDVSEIDFEDVLGKKYYLFTNEEIYQKLDNQYVRKMVVDTSKAMALDIVGVVRPNQETQVGSLSLGLVYTEALTNYLLTKNLSSSIVSDLQVDSNTTIFDTYLSDDYDQKLRELGGNNKVNAIRIFPIDFKAKEEIKTYLDVYNESVAESDRIYYTDLMDVMVKSLNTMVRIISLVLIAFTAISLVVSSIMIGIITYVSVIERTKEIGILRSIGARKKDISRVFNAETFIIGLAAGALGVSVTYGLTVPINIVLQSLVEGIGNIANLNIIHGAILILISILLTLISGLLPSRIAANKDPVIALRTE